MKGSVKNIGQKGNENRELYNNNLKVVNHMEKNINIAASGSEPETLLTSSTCHPKIIFK